MAWTTAVVGFLLAVPLWGFTKWSITSAHEGAHAAAGVMSGQKVTGVTFTAGGGGSTGFPPKMPWLADLIITLVGYLGPSAVGLGGVFLLLRGQVDMVLWISVVLLALLLIKMRNPLSIISAIGTGFVLYWVARYWGDSAQLGFTYAWVWFLLMGGTRQIPDLFWAMKHGDTSSDAAVLQRLTFLPDVFWLAVFWLAALAALVYGGSLLLRQPV